ncbi:DUF29 domain-containing protein [Candidatus Albibeggiatoa sp. nov. BB20]|uniref:DUF29 domain-containing protein n=1 Tax=Candidatus Albibeggiatoa sp. nov. BB20 TaxID=3162723 RepID=UPI0033659F0A
METQLLYDKDFYAWIYHNIELVRSKKWDEIDADLLVEELESMAKRDRHELVNHLAILIAHLLKWQFQYKQLSKMWQEFKGDSWKRSIVEQRDQIESQLQMSPSLKPYFDDAIQKAYPRAVKIAVEETQLPVKKFPKTCPYSIEQLLDNRFYPEPE